MTKNPRPRSSTPSSNPHFRADAAEHSPPGYAQMDDLPRHGIDRRHRRSNDLRWWIIISSWLLFGALTSLLLLVAIAGESPHLLFAFGLVLIIYGIPLLRGTLAKLERQRPR